MPQSAKLLPLYYKLLDPAIITTVLAHLQTCSNADGGSFHDFFGTINAQMFISLESLENIDAQGALPVARSPDFWDRLWPWIGFFNTYGENLPLLDGDLEETYALFFSIILLLRRHNTTATSIHSTPGFRIFIFRRWSQLLKQPMRRLPEFCAYIRDGPALSNDQDFEEAVEGSGGTRTSLAALIVRHIKYILELKEMSKTVDSLLYIIPIAKNKSAQDESFSRALIHEGIVKCLSSAAYRLSIPPFYFQPNLFSTCANPLLAYLDTGSRHDLFVECLRAGILRLLFPSARNISFIEAFLLRLSSHLVYLSVLSQLETSIEELNMPVNANSFNGSSVATTWRKFWLLLQRRREVVKKYRNRKQPALRACDNLAVSFPYIPSCISN